MSEILRSGIVVPIAVILVMVMLGIIFLLISSSGIPNAGGSSGLVSTSGNMNSMMAAMGVMVVTGIALMAMSRRR